MTKENTTLTDAHHVAIRVGLANSIRNSWRHRKYDTSRQIVKDAVSTLRLVRNSWKLEATPWTK
jgi:hypothetical protein